MLAALAQTLRIVYAQTTSLLGSLKLTSSNKYILPSLFLVLYIFIYCPCSSHAPWFIFVTELYICRWQHYFRVFGCADRLLHIRHSVLIRLRRKIALSSSSSPPPLLPSSHYLIYNISCLFLLFLLFIQGNSYVLSLHYLVTVDLECDFYTVQGLPVCISFWGGDYGSG